MKIFFLQPLSRRIYAPVARRNSNHEKKIQVEDLRVSPRKPDCLRADRLFACLRAAMLSDTRDIGDEIAAMRIDSDSIARTPPVLHDTSICSTSFFSPC